ncbi:hypothetical protein PHMEG_0005314 [Phytophthora megakarya]|uniref:BED-type domain-containing protein n=1 Tax=Phytophthora megakarya TaxID=4795 RepID=A0A225WT92_9STRA|nr:hypothetical protein PHMEG_0005314 [Phytophthora megakarya]
MSSTNQPISNELVCSLMFTKKSREENLCSTCSKSCKSAHGHTNLITHLRTYHPSYVEDASRAAKDRNALCVRVVDDETRNIFRCDTDCYTRRFLLLAFCPLDVEEDLGAQNLFDLIADMLSRYNKPWEAVNFVVADNYNVHQYIGNLEETTVPQPPSPSDLSLVQQAFKKRKVAKRSRYADFAFVPPTANECERFFSEAKLVYSDLRKRMDASTLEMLMFLMYKKDMWDVYTVEAVCA